MLAEVVSKCALQNLATMLSVASKEVAPTGYSIFQGDIRLVSGISLL